jgi:DNA mismatch repair protein MSH6
LQPNDLRLGGASTPATLLLTGANAGGKSTLLRSACIATIMAQLGCYVPATAASLTPVDRIFTRIGAHDRISAGESTFCVEMTETAAILLHAHPSSLVVLDEIGRGTSSFDGYAIAAAVTRYLAAATRCRVMFATHYHALTKEPDLVGLVGLGHMVTSVSREQGLVPLYRLEAGPSPEGSCGIEVAAASGLPAGLLHRATAMARVLEASSKQSKLLGTGMCMADGGKNGECKAGEEEEDARLVGLVLHVLRQATEAGGGGKKDVRAAIQAVQLAVMAEL